MAIGQVTYEITDDVQLATQIVIVAFLLVVFLTIRKSSHTDVFPVSVTNELKGLGILTVVFAHFTYMKVKDLVKKSFYHCCWYYLLVESVLRRRLWLRQAEEMSFRLCMLRTASSRSGWIFPNSMVCKIRSCSSSSMKKFKIQ